MATREGTGPINLAGSASSSTGAGSWIQIRGTYKNWAIQCSSAAGSTAFTIQLQGTISTASSGVVTLVTCGATHNGVTQFSTGNQPVSYVRKNVTACSTGGGVLPVANGC